MDDSKIEDRLSTGWRKGYTNQGKMYYINDITKTTQWNRPIPNDSNNINKKWSCSTCTFDNVSTSTQCEMCGTKNPTQPTSPIKSINDDKNIIIKNIWKCPICRMQNVTNNSICQYCGNTVQFAPSQSLQQPLQTQPPKPNNNNNNNNVQNVWKCPKCKIFNNVTSSVCKHCNTKVTVASTFQWIRNIDNDYELAIRLSKQLESVLEKHFGATGKGLHQKLTNTQKIYNSITNKQLPQHLVKNIRRLATIRNKLIHDIEYNKIDNKLNFIGSFEESYCQLQSIIIEVNNAKKQNIQRSSQSSQPSQPSHSVQQDDCIIL